MANVIPFSFDRHPVRVIERDGELWFVMNDVAEALEFSRGRDAGRMLDDDEKGAHILRTPGGDQEVIIVNESGLYALIFKSRKASAKRFKKWVTSEVLPSIRKTGRYEAAAAPVDPMPGFGSETLHDAALDLIQQAPALLLRDLRVMVSWDFGGKPQASVVPVEAVVAHPSRLASVLSDPFTVPREHLSSIAVATLRRLFAVGGEEAVRRALVEVDPNWLLVNETAFRHLHNELSFMLMKQVWRSADDAE